MVLRRDRDIEQVPVQALGAQVDGERRAVGQEQVHDAGLGLGRREDEEDRALGAVELGDIVALDGRGRGARVDHDRRGHGIGVGEDAREGGREGHEATHGPERLGHAPVFVDQVGGVVRRGVGARLARAGLTGPEAGGGPGAEVREVGLSARAHDLAELALELVPVDGVGRFAPEDGRAERAVVDRDGGLGRADAPELSHGGEQVALVRPAVDLALDALPEVVGVDARDGEARLAQVACQLAEVACGGVGIVAVPSRLVLDHDDRALGARCRLVALELFREGVEVASGGLEEGLVGRAELHAGGGQEPRGEPAQIPARSDVGAGAEDDLEAQLLAQIDEVDDVVLTFEMEGAGARLDPVPEDRGLDGVEPGEFRLVEPIAPLVARDALEMERAGDDPEALAVDGERAGVEVDRWHAELLGVSWVVGREGAARRR